MFRVQGTHDFQFQWVRAMNVTRTQTTVAIVTGVATLGLLSAWLYRRRRVSPPAQWKQVGNVKKLHLYPLKSGKRIEMNAADCDAFGVKQDDAEAQPMQLHDRAFLVYDGANREFKTARTYPKLMLVEMRVHDESHVVIDAPGMRSLYVKLPKIGENVELEVTMHRKEIIFSLDCGEEAAHWISQYVINKPQGFRLGYHNADVTKSRNLKKAHKKHLENNALLTNKSAGLYTDLTSVLILNQSSVDDLNTKISGNKVTVENFRPNIVVENAAAYSEDGWDWVKVGDAIFRNVKPCTRCMMTTIDPETAIRNGDREPLRTLETYRKLKDINGSEFEGDLTVMGLHLEVHTAGKFKVGDVVYIG